MVSTAGGTLGETLGRKANVPGRAVAELSTHLHSGNATRHFNDHVGGLSANYPPQGALAERVTVTEIRRR